MGMTQKQMMADLVELIRDQQTQHARLMEAMLAAQTAQAHVMQSWLDMFKPSATPTPSTSPDERQVLREAREAEAWDPLAMNPFQDLLHG
jgi:hypothetical protein